MSVLTNKQRTRLAANISKSDMKSIASGYMDLNKTAVNQLESENSDMQAFNREVFEKWENMNKVKGKGSKVSISLLLNMESKLTKN